MALYTNIQVGVSTREALKALGKKGESYNDLILRLISEHKGAEKLPSDETGELA